MKNWLWNAGEKYRQNFQKLYKPVWKDDINNFLTPTSYKLGKNFLLEDCFWLNLKEESQTNKELVNMFI